MRRTQITKANHFSKNGVISADDTDTVFPNADKNSKTIKINLQSKETNKSFYQYMKKDQNLPNKMYTAKIAPENPFPAIKTILEINHHITLLIEVDHPNKEIHEISHKIEIADRIVETTIHDRIQIQHNLFQHPVHNQIEIDITQTINHEIHLIIEIETIQIIEIETIQTIGIEVTQTIEIKIIQTIDHKIDRIIDRIIKDRMIITKTDQEIIHKIDTQVTTIDIEIIPNHLIGIIIVTPILNNDTEVIHQNIKDKSTKYKKMTKQLQTPQVSTTQKISNYK